MEIGRGIGAKPHKTGPEGDVIEPPPPRTPLRSVRGYLLPNNFTYLRMQVQPQPRQPGSLRSPGWLPLHRLNPPDGFASLNRPANLQQLHTARLLRYAPQAGYIFVADAPDRLMLRIPRNKPSIGVRLTFYAEQATPRMLPKTAPSLRSVTVFSHARRHKGWIINFLHACSSAQKVRSLPQAHVHQPGIAIRGVPAPSHWASGLAAVQT